MLRPNDLKCLVHPARHLYNCSSTPRNISTDDESPMHEDLEQIARLKFTKMVERISKQTHEKVKEMQQEYAARAGSSALRSGPEIASIGRAQMDGAEQQVRALSQIWVDLIERRKGHVSPPDVAFIADKVDGYALNALPTRSNRRHCADQACGRRISQGWSSRS